MLIRRKVRRASRAVMTTVTVITTAQTAITDRRKSAKEDSSAIHILSVARLSPRWDPWRCVPALRRVCRFENVKSRKQTYLKQLNTSVPEALSVRQGSGGIFFNNLRGDPRSSCGHIGRVKSRIHEPTDGVKRG